MTYYKLFYWKYLSFLIFVTIGVCKNQNIAKSFDFHEGANVNLHVNVYVKPETCLLYGPDGQEYKEYTKYECTHHTTYENLFQCGFTIRDIDVSQKGQWWIVYDEKRKPLNINVSESPVRVLVNDAVLPTTEKRIMNNSANRIFTATYLYYEGDKVDVTCISIAANNDIKKHYVTLRYYSYAKTLHNVFENTTLLSHIGVGFRTTLQGAHNNSYVLCKSAHSESNLTYKIVKVKFLQQNAINLKPITAINRNQIATDLTNNIEIKFGTSSISKDTIPLQINLPENKSFINMYTLFDKQIIYYEYEEGEHLSVNCSTSSKTMHSYKYYLYFNENVSYSTPFVTLDKQLSTADNNMIIECYLLKNINYQLSNIIRQINLVLRMSSSREEMYVISEDYLRKDNNSWIIYLAAGVVICFLICSSVIIYKVKKRSCYGQRKMLQRNSNRENSLKTVDSPNYELLNSVPSNQSANIYTNINHSTNDYVNINLSQAAITYAVLDLSTPNVSSNQVDNERPIYAEINHNFG